MILYHYPMSPFSEKVRLLFGYTATDWRSVVVPEMPPRPALAAVLEGYRRIPVAQDGADIYCDTRLIFSEIAARSGHSELAPAHVNESALTLSSALEGDVFWACVASIPASQVLRQLVRNISLLGAFRFIRDRMGVARAAVTKPMHPGKAQQVFATHLEELDRCLEQGSGYLGGDQPNYLDFAAYHTLWFQCEVGDIAAPEQHEALMVWYRRMQAFGHGRREETSAEQAQQQARGAALRPLPASEDHRLLRQQVAVQPEDYALDETRGELVAINAERMVLAAEAVVGRVHIHFPVSGFALHKV
ncbi:MAG: glutathione S-transferase family protein [Pseudomonadota bacterium]